MTSKNPAFAAQADIWFANLATFGSTLTLRATTRESVPGVGTRARFQDRAWLHEITASWRSGSAPAGRFAAQWRIWLTLVDDGDRISLAGDSDVPAADRTRPRPLWLQTAVRVDRRGPVTVLAAVGVAVDSWLVRGRASAAAVRPRITALPGPGWDGTVVIELPANQTSFERSIGAGAGSYARIGAVAWPRGDQAGSAAVHVVVNPAVADRQPAEGLAVLLTHEIVHVATRSFASAAPTWLVEGFADRVAYDAYPTTRTAALRPLRDAVRAGWLPIGLPPESAFAASAPDLDRAYAEAWSLCSLIADRYGADALARIYAAAGAGTAIDTTLRGLGTTEAGLLRDWRAELRRLGR